jgi:uncharacterized phage protein gp47/JayE
MPFSFPQLPDLRTRTRALLQSRIAGADTTLRFSTLGILADVMGGEDWSEYRSGVYVSKQMFIATAEAPYLDTRLSDYGLTRLGATYAAGNAILSGTVGMAIPLGTQVQTSDGSQVYTTQSAGSIGGGGTVTLPILASTAGSAGNAVANASLVLGVAIAGVLPAVQVDGAGLTGGTDQETDDAFRARGLARIRQPPQGGAATDYLAWVKQYAGVTRAWVYPLNRGAGTVDVFFAMDGRANPLPLAGDLAGAEAIIQPLRPVTADVQTVAPTAGPVAVTITGMVPNDAGTQAQVQAQLQALMASIGPGAATIGDGVSAAQPGGHVDLNQIYAAIQAGGAQLFDLTLPAADVVLGTGVLPELGAVTFV